MSTRVLTLRPLVARVTNGFVWRSPLRAARLLFSFAHAEAGSRVDLIVAAQLTASPVRRALYVRHALDEARHAKLFSLRSAELLGKVGAPPLGFLRPDADDLFERLG